MLNYYQSSTAAAIGQGRGPGLERVLGEAVGMDQAVAWAAYFERIWKQGSK
jgi:hypothetical protein